MISIIIVNYNVAPDLDICLASVREHFKSEYEVIVVDNCSAERDVEQLEEKYPEFKFLFLEDNLGFAHANNLAADYAKGEFILFLNPDTIIIENFAEQIITHIKTVNNAGACGPMLVNKDLSFQSSAGIELGYIYEFCEAFFLIRILRGFYKSFYLKPNSGRIKKVHWLSAACMIIQKDIFVSSGKFNTAFFMNYEDIDFCNRITRAGYKNYYFPALKCIHLDHKSQKKNYERLVYSRYASRFKYWTQNYNPFKLRIVRIMHYNGLLLRIFIAKFKYNGPELKQRLSGYQKAMELFQK